MTGHGDAEAPPDIMLRLRSATAAEHQQLEDTLDLLDPGLTPVRLGAVLTRMHAFWVAAEAGLGAWADAEPADAAAVGWAGRRRADLFATDLRALGVALTEPPGLPAPASTDEALGTLYVLEGSTLGGVFIDRHLAATPALAGVGPIRVFNPYRERTGAMWADFRRCTRDHVARGGDPDALVGAAGRTFQSLAAWCADVQHRASDPVDDPATARGGEPA